MLQANEGSIQKRKPHYTCRGTIPGKQVSQRTANSEQRFSSHAFVVRPAAALGWHPGDDFVRIHDVAGLAVYAIGRVQVDLQTARRVGGFDHLVHTGRAEVLARVAEFLHAAFIADVGIVNDQMRRLVFFVLCARVVDVGELIEGEFAVALCGTDNVRLQARRQPEADRAAPCADVRLR